MDFNTLSKQLNKVVSGYLEKFNLKVTDDQALLKIHEEVGELTKAYLRYIEIGRNKENKTKQQLKQDLAEELADVIGLCLVFADRQELDLESAFEEKWLKWLDE